MDRNKILEDIEEIFEICQERNIGSNETELDIRETITDYIVKKLTLTDVVNSVYVVTERDNYGEQLFKQVFASRDKAVGYLAEQGLKEGNVDEITEIEFD